MEVTGQSHPASARASHVTNGGKKIPGRAPKGPTPESPVPGDSQGLSIEAIGVPDDCPEVLHRSPRVMHQSHSA